MGRITFFWLFIAALIVYGIGFSVDVMDVDSAQYASISREMADTGGYLQVKYAGNDYLDKPPLLFWVTSLFFNILGFSNWSFKIGSFLFTLLGVYSTFRLGKLLYNSRIGRLAAIILFSCQAFFLFNNDVRTDTILTASVIFAIWQLADWLNNKRWIFLVGASLGIAFAMLAKGPIGLMVPVLAIFSYLAGRARWKDMFRWQYLILLLLVALFLAPMLWGLYQQFDLHPEKDVAMVTPNGLEFENGISGLKFYLWTQSFGRLTGDNVWSNNAGPFFFIHNFLWSFLPWALLFVMAFVNSLVKTVRASIKGEELPELLTLGGFLLPFIALSLSNYKLPHYIYVVYPLGSVLLAAWWENEVWEKGRKGFKIASLFTQLLVWIASVGVISLIYGMFFPGFYWWMIAITAILMTFALYLLVQFRKQPVNLIIGSILISLAANFTLNLWFYPNLMHYQAGSNVARYIQQQHIDAEEVYTYNFSSFSLGYYLRQTVKIGTDDVLREKLEEGQKVYVITRDPYQGDLREDFKVKTIKEFGTHSVTLLNMQFLNPETRLQTLQRVYLMEILGESNTMKNEK